MATDIVTFGCRLNTFESEVMRNHAAAAGLDDAVIVNTCAVTGEAERQARQAIRRLRRERPGARIVVTGCAAQLHPDAFAAMPEVDRVLGNVDKMREQAWHEAAQPDGARVAVADVMVPHDEADPAADAFAPDRPGPLLSGFAERTRAFVQVQQGCDHRCTFCVIPLSRGPSRSLPRDRIVEQVRALVANGYREVVLTGVDITAYGDDLPDRPSLGRLVRDLLTAVPGLERLRLSSLDPVEVDDELLAVLADDPRLMPHIHLSLQAGDDLTLKRMRRRHRRADALRLAERLHRRRPGLALGADLIAGFPTETDAMFESSLSLVDAMGLTHVHIFPYSPRPDTPAARMPAVAGPVVRDRAARLRAAGADARARFLAGRVGGRAAVLVERPGFGHSEDYLPVHLADTGDAPGSVAPDAVAPGEVAHVVLTATGDDYLCGELAR